MKKVLIVEDDIFLGKLSKKKLEDAQFEVTHLKDGQDVLATAKKILPAAIILDLVMPNKDGFTTLEELKANAETQSIPVLVVSALNGKEDIERVQNMGAKEYFVKSQVDLDTIIEYLQQL